MKQTQDLSIKQFDLFARCVEAAAQKSIRSYDGYSMPLFHANRVRRTLEFRYESESRYCPEKYNWTFDSKEGLSGPGAEQTAKNSMVFYVLYKLFALYFLDDETILDDGWNLPVSQWDSERNNVDHLYKIKATFLGAHCSGGNHYGSELNEAYLYKVKWTTRQSQIRPDFTRVLYQKEHISLTRYSQMYNILYEMVKLTSGEAMGILRKIDSKINNYVKHKLGFCD